MEEELMEIKNKQSRILFYFMLLLGLLGSLTILFQNIFRWSIVDIFTPFFAPFIDMIGYLFFVVCSLIVFLYFIVSKPSNKCRNSIPLLLNLVVLICVLIIPISSITLKLDFRIHKSEREEVIKMVVDGSLKSYSPNNNSVIHLPEIYNKLSKGGGDIIVKENGQVKQILFFTYRGVLDNFAGFIYTIDGNIPDEQLFGKFIEIRKIENNWYWVSAT